MPTASQVAPTAEAGASATPSTDSKAAAPVSFIVWATSVSGILTIIFWLVFSYGAAKLSYDKYRSIGWAILDFFFSYYYYPYYALVLNSPTQAMIAAGRRR
jgi:hypothetical protein